MSAIIAARFHGQAPVQQAAGALRAAGFESGRMCAFFVNPPGMHNLHPYGGDERSSPGAEETGMGAVAGIAAGAVVGIAAVPLVGVVGPFLGAYIGSLVGGMMRTKELEQMPHPGSPGEHPSGMMLAVALRRREERELAIAILQQQGGFGLEEAQGSIEDGDWVDFDPRAAPHLLPAPTGGSQRRP